MRASSNAQFKLTGKHLKRADADRIFIAATTMNSEDKSTLTAARRQVAGKSTKHDMTRREFYVAIVRLAIQKYIFSKQMSDVSEAVERLIATEILAKALAADSSQPCLKHILIDPNQFRQEHCYIAQTSEALLPHESSMRALFGALCEPNQKEVLKLKAQEAPMLLTLSEWLLFVRGARLTGSDLRERDATLCLCAHPRLNPYLLLAHLRCS